MRLLGAWGGSQWLLRLGWAEPGDAARRDELSASEQERAAALVSAADRAAYVAAHLLARDCARAFLGSAELGEWQQRCATCTGDRGRLHGRPSFSARPELAVSLAHSGHAVAALVGTAPCGVDVEVDRRIALPRRMLSDAENAWLAQSPAPQRDLLRLWCRKEALLKAAGGDDPAGIGVLDPTGPLDVIGDYRLVEFPWPDGVLVAALGDSGRR
ncbi:4'-phosphopantetheinyl transferase family protein [Nocardioides sp. Bht2]|uniref:4'-phosphopantetheinyl transferase family protein n=1 Tax=Nocardioides sp. Bht2 TaxID=3392297 RepID=UPI0039B6552D